jgi:hypothetical protein
MPVRRIDEERRYPAEIVTDPLLQFGKRGGAEILVVNRERVVVGIPDPETASVCRLAVDNRAYALSAGHEYSPGVKYSFRATTAIGRSSPVLYLV